MSAQVAYRRTFGEKTIAASGTVYLAPGPSRIPLLKAWEEKVKAAPKATDQVCLDNAVQEAEWVFQELPPEYCWIFDFDMGDQRLAGGPNPEVFSPVIEHMQASRWVRRR
jgi:hypothetical protein